MPHSFGDRIDPRLCLMMFLQHAAVGVWMPILPSYLKADESAGGLGFSGFQVGWIVAVSPALGAMTAPFLAGQLADRHLSGERYLSAAFLVSSLSLWLLSWQSSFSVWAGLMVVYAVSFIPTMGIATALTMSHLRNPSAQFPQVRVWGTLGWIVVAWSFPAVFLQENVGIQLLPPFVDGTDRADATARIANALRVSAAISCGSGLFCFLLPHTPPARSRTDALAFVSALRLFRYRSIVVLVGSSMCVAAIDRVYFVQTAPYLEALGLSTGHIMPAMALGQIAEIAVMAFLGRLLTGLGFRRVLLLGAFCSFLRYVIFGATWLPLPIIVGSQMLHGVCFGCSFVAAAIYIDRLVPAGARHSAQTGFTLIAMGPGAIAGGFLNGLLERLFLWNGQLHYGWFWCSCAAIGLVATLGLLCFFRDESD